MTENEIIKPGMTREQIAANLEVELYKIFDKVTLAQIGQVIRLCEALQPLMRFLADCKEKGVL